MDPVRKREIVIPPVAGLNSIVRRNDEHPEAGVGMRFIRCHRCAKLIRAARTNRPARPWHQSNDMGTRCLLSFPGEKSRVPREINLTFSYPQRDD